MDRLASLYAPYVSEKVRSHLLARAAPVRGVAALSALPTPVTHSTRYETPEALQFMCALLDETATALADVLDARVRDRAWIDETTSALVAENNLLGRTPADVDFGSVIGRTDASGRVVVGPRDLTSGTASVTAPRGERVAPLPPHLQGPHVTLFGPADDPKMALNAMNAFHRRLPHEPPLVAELIGGVDYVPKWGADNEDSKTPLRAPLRDAMANLAACFDGTIRHEDQGGGGGGGGGSKYELASAQRLAPIKRIPGLALPSTALFYQGSPVPLHVLDFSLHLFWMWRDPRALTFYVPKLENDEEAAYLRTLIAAAERLVRDAHPQYELGSVRILCVLENPRAIFRLNEMMDALHPYFAGASLGWHDYLASAARLFREDASYRIPVKADPNIVLKNIRESHALLSEVVKARGGIAIGGMYGVLPVSRELTHSSMQQTLIGYVRDVVTQLKRNLDGFWVAHPDFVRIGVALVEAYHADCGANAANASLPPPDGKVAALVRQLIADERAQRALVSFVCAPDPTPKLDARSPLYHRELLAAHTDLASAINHHADEVRYNVFQALQYLADWLRGNGCVALPAAVNGTRVRIMDDLATTERSRWEVWHEIRHGRFEFSQLLEIVAEEMAFIEAGARTPLKEVAVPFDERTRKWYPVARRLLVRLMSDEEPPEFATELLMLFTVPSVRDAADPWAAAVALDAERYFVREFVRDFDAAYEVCPARAFCDSVAHAPPVERRQCAQRALAALSVEAVRDAAGRLLDAEFDGSASLSTSADEGALRRLFERRIDAAYGKQDADTSLELAAELAARGATGISVAVLSGDEQVLYAGAPMRSEAAPGVAFVQRVPHIKVSTFCAGVGTRDGAPLHASMLLQIASLSKPVATAFAMDFLRECGLTLESGVNEALQRYGASFRLRAAAPLDASVADSVQVQHLFSHTALGQHYVFGFEATASHPLPSAEELLRGDAKWNGYDELLVHKVPDTSFNYSGGAFVVLQLLLEAVGGAPINQLMTPWLKAAGLYEHLQVTDRLGAPDSSCVLSDGFNDDGEAYARLTFPPLAAGMLGSARGVALFLRHLCVAYAHVDGSGPISHDTAVHMLRRRPSMGSREFMNADVGLGIFVTECGANRIALHQASNEGYRGIFAVCFAGPNRGDGFVLLTLGDLSAAMVNCAVARRLLDRFEWHGCVRGDALPPIDSFSGDGLAQEEVINQCYRQLLFAAFTPDRPEQLAGELAPRHELSEYDVLRDARLLSVTNEGFARADNLVMQEEPRFDAAQFGRHGKIMDSWESSRHNPGAGDLAVFRLAASDGASISFVEVSTKWHDGNHAHAFGMEANESEDGSGEWHCLVRKSPLEGHSVHTFVVPPREAALRYRLVRFRLMRDGGISRVRCYSAATLPLEHRSRMASLHASIKRCAEPFPSASAGSSASHAKAASVPLDVLASRWRHLLLDARRRGVSFVDVNVASAAYGARIVGASNEHYGPAHAVISASLPSGMFDGFETKRARERSNTEWFEVELATTTPLRTLVFDMTYFVHNNPLRMRVDASASDGDEFVPLVEERFVKAYSGNVLVVRLGGEAALRSVRRLRVVVAPCGGMNRVHALARLPVQSVEKLANVSKANL